MKWQPISEITEADFDRCSDLRLVVWNSCAGAEVVPSLAYLTLQELKDDANEKFLVLPDPWEEGK